MLIFAWILLVMCVVSVVSAPLSIGKVRTYGSTANSIFWIFAMAIFFVLFIFVETK